MQQDTDALDDATPTADGPVDGAGVVATAPAPEQETEAVTPALLELLEAALLAVNAPLTLERLQSLFTSHPLPSRKLLREALLQLQESYNGRVAEVVEVASGWRIQVRERFGEALASLWEEKPPRFSRALLETLALIVYRQPITRGEVEEIRGVSLSPNIIRTLMEREWVRSLGVREVPGRPELLGTTRQFLDDFGIKSLDELPSLPEIRDLDALAGALQVLTGEAQPELLAASEREAAERARAETTLADAAAERAEAAQQDNPDDDSYAVMQDSQTDMEEAATSEPATDAGTEDVDQPAAPTEGEATAFADTVPDAAEQGASAQSVPEDAAVDPEDDERG